MWMLIRIAISVVAAHLLAYGFAHAENDASRYLLQRKAGIAHAQKIVSEHVVSNPASVEFRKVRYFEHHSYRAWS